MDESTDPVVAAALRTLEPPPARPDFWAELVERLADADADDAAAAGAGERPPATRRRRVRPWLVGAVAAGVAAGTVTVLVLAGTGAPERLTVLGPTPTPSLPVASPAAGERAERAVVSWIRDVDANDAESAWAALGPQSRDAIGGRAGFDGAMLSELGEGWAAWSNVSPLDVRAFPLGRDAWVVTLHGVVTQEGETSRRTVAMAVRVGAGSEQVEPFVASVGLITVGSVVPLGAPLGLHAAADATAYAVVLDGTAVAASALVRGDDGSVREVRPSPALAPGTHALVVAYTTPSGALAVDAVDFGVA